MTAAQPTLFAAAPVTPAAYDTRPGPSHIGYIRNAIKAAVARAAYGKLTYIAVVDDAGACYGFRFQETGDRDAWPIRADLEDALLLYLIATGAATFTAADVTRALEGQR